MVSALLFDEDEWVLHGVNVFVGKTPSWVMLLIGVKDAELMIREIGNGPVRGCGEQSKVACLQAGLSHVEGTHLSPIFSRDDSIFYVFEWAC